MYKLVAIDLDGTLVTNDKKLTNKTIEVIKNALKKDVKIMISSARSFYRLEKYINELGMNIKDQYTICFNGGMIVENLTGKILYSKNLEEDEVFEIVELGRRLNAPMILYSKDAHNAEKIPDIVLNNKNSKGINYKIGDFDKINFDEEDNYIYRIAFIDKPERILEIRKNIPQDIAEKYEVTSSVPEYIEFVKKGITKTEAIKFIMNKCNIKQNEVMAIGDGENDIQMLKFAHLGVAMENATDSVKKIANYITTSNNEDGVGNVIEKYILEK